MKLSKFAPPACSIFTPAMFPIFAPPNCAMFSSSIGGNWLPPVIPLFESQCSVLVNVSVSDCVTVFGCVFSCTFSLTGDLALLKPEILFN